MTDDTKHISVCVCTYKRPAPLRRLLETLEHQETGGRFTYSIVVADNDSSQSAKAVVSDFAATSSTPIRYCLQPRRNIALTRNTAIENAHGEFIAFIDDDEFATRRWLLTLFEACNRYAADGVLGPVKPHFDEEPPKWISKGKFFDRPTHRTGQLLDWSQTRTGNVLLKRQLFAGESQPFRPEFLSGEDQDFFRKMMNNGRTFVWCNEAVVYEVVPPVRWKRGFLVRRALHRGAFTPAPPPIAKSVIAVPAYASALPVALVLGQARFMGCVCRLFYHVGRIVALLRINPIRESYPTY